MKTTATPLIPGLASVILIIALPLTGIFMTGKDPSYYLQFPPAAGYTLHAPFSPTVFIVLLTGIILIIMHPAIHIVRSAAAANVTGRIKSGFPWWGTCGLILCAAAWFIAWTRLPCFTTFQRFTFIPLWASYIIIINALCIHRTGRSLATHNTLYFAALFPLSAGFWWIFEYLNRFTANWYYTGVDELTAVQYILEATLAFSTVLPAVMSTGELLKSFPMFYAGMDSYIKINIFPRRNTALAVLLTGGTGLAFTGVFPELLFPLLWISPLMILSSTCSLFKYDTIFSGLTHGDWRLVIIYSLSALTCGFFWELWNINSMAKWIYSIPYVQGFKIFEMPLPGYAGYLPFGLECAVVAGLLRKHKNEYYSDTADIKGYKDI